ncbi:hypothetical protein F4780DRAFT_66244 [Xylariomycetidae sp. FL0641]|nr:hypothetical protein F4780DRAFT_66244 [Xylariomycetidae sp. FL0641]
MLSKSPAYALGLLASLPAASAHSWVESLFQINSKGALSGTAGYPIGYIPHGEGGDDAHLNKILDTSTNPPVCKPVSDSNYDQYPRLKAAPGDHVAMLYQENGHVTQPELTPRPYRGGNVYVYGTLQHKDSDGINDVLNAWTADGTGGNGKGKLIATHYFDDGECYQAGAPAGNQIYAQRHAKTGQAAQWCQTDFQIPEDLKESDGKYTVMWVWDWPLITSETQNVTEIYTSCAEIDLSSVKADSMNTDLHVKGVSDGDMAAVPKDYVSSQVKKLIEATALGLGTLSPAAPTGLDQPATASSPAHSSGPVPTKPLNGGHAKAGIKTVTVTADPVTVTQFTTVTAGNAAEAHVTSQASAAPTEVSGPVSVTSVTPFMALRRARVTGQARREAEYLE